jgi:serine/threonine protein kinase
MSEPAVTQSETLGVVNNEIVDAKCEDFEEAWRAVLDEGGSRPRIEDYLGDTTEPTRSELLKELLRVDLDRRRDQREQPTVADYASRFREHQTTIEQVFAERRPGALPHVPGFKVLAELGRGGMGVVYQARDLNLDRDVALKMMLAGGHADAEQSARFLAEARAAARLQHPNVVQIHEIGEHQGAPYFSLEYVDGGTLAARLKVATPSDMEAARLVELLARTVHYAHERGIVHRDLKPANILLSSNDIPKIADFGLAKILSEDGGLTHTGAILGTLNYMAPEQAAGTPGAIGPATDIYALGVILYELLTGQPPFRVPGPEALHLVIRQPPPSPSVHNPRVDRALEAICLKCLEKDPKDRYKTADALANDLAACQRGESIAARPPTLLQTVGRQFVKRREVLAPLPWSYLCFFGAAITSGFHAANFWITQPEGPIRLFVPCVALYAFFAALLDYFFLARRRHLFTPDERDIVIFHRYFVCTAFALYAASYPWRREDILMMYPALALVSCLYCFILARLYWGPLYMHGLAYLALAFVMKLKPEWAPLAFATLYAILSVVSGIIFLVAARRSV